MRVAVCGGVESTAVLINKLFEHGVKNLTVFGYRPLNTDNVSGWVDLEAICKSYGIEFHGFRRVTEIEPELQRNRPDILFIVGLSQIVPESLIQTARHHAIGFHPTKLPKGRGRAAIAWLLMTKQNGAASFFKLEKGIDDGAVLNQTPFKVTHSDTARTVMNKTLQAMKQGLDGLIPALLEGKAKAADQDHDEASWFARRSANDGWINWQASSEEIDLLVRASSEPHPGAKTVSGSSTIIIWAIDLQVRNEIGVPGRVMEVFADHTFTVQAGDVPIRVLKWEAEGGWEPKVGQLLGYKLEFEVLSLRRKIADLESLIKKLEAKL